MIFVKQNRLIHMSLCIYQEWHTLRYLLERMFKFYLLNQQGWVAIYYLWELIIIEKKDKVSVSFKFYPNGKISNFTFA